MKRKRKEITHNEQNTFSKENKKRPRERERKNLIKPIDKRRKIGYNNNVRSAGDGMLPEMVKKITAVFEAGGYLFLLLKQDIMVNTKIAI